MVNCACAEWCDFISRENTTTFVVLSLPHGIHSLISLFHFFFALVIERFLYWKVLVFIHLIQTRIDSILLDVTAWILNPQSEILNERHFDQLKVKVFDAIATLLHVTSCPLCHTCMEGPLSNLLTLANLNRSTCSALAQLWRFHCACVATLELAFFRCVLHAWKVEFFTQNRTAAF